MLYKINKYLIRMESSIEGFYISGFGDKTMDGKGDKVTDIIDSELLLSIQAGNQEAFKKLFFKYYQRLSDFAYTYVGCKHRSEEIVQDVFEHIWDIKGQLDPSINLRSYLFTCVKNKAFDKIKKEKTEQKYIEKFAQLKEKKTYSKKRDKGKSAFERKAQEAIEKLPDRAKKVYKLSRREGLTYKEIATVLNISIKTVESHMGRALKKLRTQLERFLPSY